MQPHLSLNIARHGLCLHPKIDSTLCLNHATTTACRAAQRADLSSLESACYLNKACIGENQLGYRGLLASESVRPNEVVVSVPLHNVLQVPRHLGNPGSIAATEAALAGWQKHHGTLPKELQHLILDADCPWEAKLVYWLLYLKATASPGSIWHTYCQALPPQEDTLSFFCYSQQQAEQLQFSTWKALADKQRALLLEVQQQGQKLHSSSTLHRGTSGASSANTSTSTSIQEPTQQNIMWALSTVKSRTFARPLQQDTNRPGHNPAAGSCDASSAAAEGSFHSREAVTAGFDRPPNQGSHQAELDTDDGDVMLLMVPVADMINHSQHHNCSFRVNWSRHCFEVISISSIPQGGDITISYGSNKSNLALLSCYGFFIPGNHLDAQLLQPIFACCTSVVGDIGGFDARMIQAATRQRGLDIHGAGCQMSNSEQGVQIARVKAAAAALPADAPSAAGTSLDSSQPRLRSQKYLAELISYQVQQMQKLCETTLEEDASLLQNLQNAGHARDGNWGHLEQAIYLQNVAMRSEQKMVLIECRNLCQLIIKLVVGALQASE